MVLSFAGGREGVAALLEARGMRVLWAIPISNADASTKPCRRKCMACCMKVNCKLYTFASSANLLRFWEASVVQVIPTPLHVLDRISPIVSPVFSRFLCVFTVSPRRFQRAQNRNPGPSNSVNAQTPFRPS